MTRRLLSALAGLFALAVMAMPAAAFPERTVRIVVPFPAGGSNDVIARIMAQRLSEIWKQPVVVENRGGAGGNVGAEAVARADADGYTLLLAAPGPLAINPSLFQRLNFDPLKDFAPVALAASVPIVLAVHPQVRANSVAELVALARAEPGKLHFGSSGAGSTNHLAGELFKALAGIDIVHVPYRGAAPAMNDLVAGHIPMMFDNMPAILPQVQAKRINAIAVAGATRASALPDVPTVAESGIPGFEAFSWFGVVAPARTPPDVLKKLEDEIAAILKLPDMRQRLADLGSEPGALGGAAFGTFLKEETVKWAKLIQASGARLQ